MPDLITIRHPVTGGVSHVHPKSVPAWRESGWVADEPEPEAAPGKPETPTAPTRRRTQPPADEPGQTDDSIAGASTTTE